MNWKRFAHELALSMLIWLPLVFVGGLVLRSTGWKGGVLSVIALVVVTRTVSDAIARRLLNRSGI